MRKLAIILILSTAFITFGCFKEDHSVRVKNNYSEDITSIKIGPASFGSISSGSSSGYKNIDEGSNTISGSTSGGQVITGSVSVEGDGKHEWTVTISSSGGFSIDED